MSDYIMNANSLKRSTLLFADSLSKGLSVPKRKFVRDMVLGILAAKSVQLASISRSLHESIDLKKTQECLSRNLSSLSNADCTHLLAKHALSFRTKVKTFTPILLDHTDIAKVYAQKMEGLSYVWDGSKKSAFDKGYCICEAAIFDDEAKLATPVYTDLYSFVHQKFISTNHHLFQALDFLHSCYQSKGIYTMDRGMDDQKVFAWFAKRKLSFSIRLVGNRHVVTRKGEKLLVSSLIQRYKGKFSHSFSTKNGKIRQIAFSVIPVQIPAVPDHWFVMLVVSGYSFKPLVILTNPPSTNKDILLHFIEAYIARWNIEEIFRYRKVSSALESIQVRSLRRIASLNLLAMLAAAYTAILCQSPAHQKLYCFLFAQAKRERNRSCPFPVYAVADGIRTVFARFRSGIRDLIPLSCRPPDLQQLSIPQAFYTSAFQVV